MNSREFLFTSESVTEGHPDKMADQVSDAILDAILEKDKSAHVACETMLKTGVVIVAGEITTSSWVNIPEIARETIKKIGYNNSLKGFDYETCGVMVAVESQSADICQGVRSACVVWQGNHVRCAAYGGESRAAWLVVVRGHPAWKINLMLRKEGEDDTVSDFC